MKLLEEEYVYRASRSSWGRARVGVRTDDRELSAGRVVVQGGVHDAGVDALITLRHLRDGQGVRVHDEPV